MMLANASSAFPAQAPMRRTRRKRKADAPPENNERLSKRLSLLNLEASGNKLYIPVEHPQSQAAVPPTASSEARPLRENDRMQLDDDKHKVYIYDLDDELSSESEPEDGKLVFLPDIEKHLRSKRIPPPLVVDPAAEAAGRELVLYSVPSSITIPEERDSVRKAIIDARARALDKQREDLGARALSPTPAPTGWTFPVTPEISYGSDGWRETTHGLAPTATERDPDAMELD